MGKARHTLGVAALLALAGCVSSAPPAPQPHARVSVARDDSHAQSTPAQSGQPQGVRTHRGHAQARPQAAPELSAAESYRARVERRAFQRGVRIIWVHPPKEERAAVDPATDMAPPSDPFRYRPGSFR